MQKDRKKVHKKIVKAMRRRNKQLATDEYIGLDRFRIDILSEEMYRFPDGNEVELFYFVKLSDKLTGNCAVFHTNNFRFNYQIFEYANDFLIRCSSGRSGHYPPLHYVAYDVHEIIPYEGGSKKDSLKEAENGVINKYNWLHWNVFEDEELAY